MHFHVSLKDLEDIEGRVLGKSKGSATIILCGRKNMSVTLWFTVLKLIYEAY